MNRTISNFLLIFPILLLLVGFSLLLSSCNPNYNPDKQYKSGKEVKATPVNSKATNIEYITGPVSNNSQSDQGLYKVTLDDGKEILIYRGTESVSMIQLK
jgi:hypothetical protein